MKKAFILFVFLISALLSTGQDVYLDSLNKAFADSKDNIEQTKILYSIGDYDHTFRVSFWDSIIVRCKDIPALNTIKGNALNNSGIISDMLGNREEAEGRYLEAIALFESLKDTANLAMCIWNFSTHKQDLAEYEETLRLMNQSMDLYLSIGDELNVAGCKNGLAVTYDYLGLPLKAMELYEEAFEYLVHTSDTLATANVLTNIATIYSGQGDSKTAEDYYLRAIKMIKRVGEENSPQMLTNYNNLATLYWNQGKREEAKLLFERNLVLQTKYNYIQDRASTLLNLAKLYAEEGFHEKAEKSFNESIDIYASMESSYDMAHAKRDFGKYLMENGNIKDGLKYANQSYQLAININSLESEWLAIELLAEINSKLGNFQEAYNFQKRHEQIGDSLINSETLKSVMSKKYEMDYLTKTVVDSINQAKADIITEARIAEGEAILKSEKQQGYFLIGGVFMLLVFGLFIVQRLRIAKKQSSMIEKQKKQVDIAYDQLEAKSNEILDSIAYAKRIQSAILPPSKVVKEYLKESFILYKPKDIVAGDFYWLEHKDEKVLFAAADCTGHGVPGAMVSVICNNGLNRSVREYGLTVPGEILDKTREIVIQEFEKSEEEVKDGMDIALCSLEGNTLQYSGAHNPLWIIRKGEVLETRANKQPIGKFDKQLPYTTHTFELKKGDSIYIFSDGYVDQFGGERGKKFKSKTFRSLLLSIQDKSMEEQKELTDKAFETWRGNLEQIDDVCVIGVRI